MYFTQLVTDYIKYTFCEFQLHYQILDQNATILYILFSFLLRQQLIKTPNRFYILKVEIHIFENQHI